MRWVSRLAWRAACCCLAASTLAGCSAANFDIPGAGDQEALYSRLHPFYAEYCALSQIKKKPGFGADIRGEVGGHAVFYLNGACLDRAAHYPVLRVCDAAPGAVPDGVGLSMNEHFRNAKWVATPGRAFFFAGGLAPGEAVTRDAYLAVRARAAALNIYDGVEFHPEVFRDAPPGTPPETWKYEVSIATDFAVNLGRGRYCARVPVTPAQMAAMVAFLNDQNAPYRRGEREFRWSILRDNCIHLAHNALAAAGLWRDWPINQPFLLALFDFPVPKNEFVNLARRTNDAVVADPVALWRDPATRRGLLDFGRLPLEPGSTVESVPPRRPNAVYDTDLALVFYDEPNFGPYRRWFDRIFREPRYFDLRRNTEHAATAYRAVLAARRPLEELLPRTRARTDTEQRDFAAFYDRFYAHAARQDAAAAADLRRLDALERDAIERTTRPPGPTSRAD